MLVLQTSSKDKELQRVAWIYNNPSIYVAVSSKKKGDVNRISYCLYFKQGARTRSLRKLYEFTVIPRFTSHLVPKKGDVNQISYCLYFKQAARTRSFKKLHEYTIIPRFTSQIVPKKDDVNRNDVNWITYCSYYKIVCFWQGA